mmetsp:Transcript_40334/g.67000  ORF Transcript_40334/g.67000 Transcript_40334/m.67000 type:complete len:84 (-) Transcript_40334:993-1244(-)
MVPCCAYTGIRCVMTRAKVVSVVYNHSPKSVLKKLPIDTWGAEWRETEAAEREGDSLCVLVGSTSSFVNQETLEVNHEQKRQS